MPSHQWTDEEAAIARAKSLSIRRGHRDREVEARAEAIARTRGHNSLEDVSSATAWRYRHQAETELMQAKGIEAPTKAPVVLGDQELGRFVSHIHDIEYLRRSVVSLAAQGATAAEMIKHLSWMKRHDDLAPEWRALETTYRRQLEEAQAACEWRGTGGIRMRAGARTYAAVGELRQQYEAAKRRLRDAEEA